MKTALLAELKHEAANTRKMIERVPTEKLEWRPHAKSMTIGRLATHIAELPVWFERILTIDEFDFAKAVFGRDTKENTEMILRLFDERLGEAVSILEHTDDETLNGQWNARRNEQLILQLPKKVALRNFAYNHLYHHRGQLSVYLRLLDIGVPGMYGPSADEKM
jgi:uncharacterized damage-inducible protein DinB